LGGRKKGMNLVIQTVELTKKYGEKVALDRLNLQVPEGSIFGLLGPNGAGKTTTMKLLLGLRKPSSGKVFLLGKDVSLEPVRSRESLGYLPENPTFYGWMRAREFLLFAGSFSKVSRKELGARVDYLLDLVSLRKTREPIRNFSRGMRQRLGIAQALVNNPRLLLLDEPTSALDPVGRREVLEAIKSLHGGVTVFLSTHILGDVERVCDTVAVLNEGVLLAQESISSLRQKHSRRKVIIETGEDKGEFLFRLRRSGWVEDVQKENNKFSFKVSDISRCEMEIPKILSELELPLKRMEVEEPNLEEIFLEILKKDNDGSL